MTTKSERKSSGRAAASSPRSSLAASAPIRSRSLGRQTRHGRQATAQKQLQAGEDEADPTAAVVNELERNTSRGEGEPTLSREEAEKTLVQRDHSGDRDDGREQEARSPRCEHEKG